MTDFLYNKDLLEAWVEALRPTIIEAMILPERLKTRFKKFIEQGTIPNIMLISPTPGSGKSSMAKILLKELKADVLHLNGSAENKIENIRNDVTDFASKSSMHSHLKVVFIDEADGLTPEAVLSLKTLMEDKFEYVRFVFTCNDEYKIIDAVRSRFMKIYFEVTEEERKDMINLFVERMVEFFDLQNISYDPKVVFKVFKDYFPDYRDAIQELNDIYYSTGEVKEYHKGANKKVVETFIKCINDKDLIELERVISNTPSINWKMIYSQMMVYHTLLEKYNQVDVICCLADWQYKNAFVPDKIVNFLGCCADIISRGEDV